jgi:MoxR-like ATPase
VRWARAYHEAMATAPRLSPTEVAEIGSRLTENIARVVKAPERVVRDLIVALFADGHVLIEDAPGVGKTALARALARSLDTEHARVQGTSDLLPADLVGTNVFNQRTASFEFHPGPVFANVVLVDEINRASPKTQSGLLECMQERQITIDGTKHQLARPFVVLATQNPSEYEGTYPLPEAELDRFMVRVSLGYPAAEAEAAMLSEHADRDPIDDLNPVADVTDVGAAQAALGGIEATEQLRSYVVAVCEATRQDERVELGASPRAGLMLFRAAKALAALEGRDHVLPDDVQALAISVLSHRLLLSFEVDGDQREAVVREAIDKVPAL